MDTGLLCYLLHLRKAEDLTVHPLRGQIFETFIVSEIYPFHTLERSLPFIFGGIEPGMQWTFFLISGQDWYQWKSNQAKQLFLTFSMVLSIGVH